MGRCAPDTLLVSWHWPPTNRASTGVLANLLRNAPAERFRVITRRLPCPREGDGTAVPPFETHTVPWVEKVSGTSCLRGPKGAAHKKAPTPSPRELGLAAWLGSVRATRSMVRVARRLHETRPFERVVAVYPHRFSLLAGWWIARRTGVPLVAYMHDLFAEAYLTGSLMKRTFWRWLDQRALTDAALVVVPTEDFAAHYRTRGIDRTLVLPHCTPAGTSHGLQSARARARGSLPPAPDGTLKLVYAGNLYDAHEDSATAFLTASDSLNNVEVTLLTPPHPMLRGRPAQWAGREQTRTAVRQADVCLLFLGHQTPYPQEVHGCFPSKMVDYLAAGRPILAIVPPGCFVDRFVRASGAGIVVNTLAPHDIREAINALRDAGLRERLADAARRTAHGLRPEVHLPRFLHGLRTLDARKDEVCAVCQPIVTRTPHIAVGTTQEEAYAAV